LTPYTPLIAFVQFYAPRVPPFTAIRDDVIGCVNRACLMPNARADDVRRHLILAHNSDPIDVFAVAFQSVVDAWEHELVIAIDDDEPALVTENNEQLHHE
jgi:hypothetical protein